MTMDEAGKGGAMSRHIEDIADIAGFEREADASDEAARTAPETEPDADLDLETPEADAAEQRTDLLQYRDEPIIERPAGDSREADPVDRAEQRRVVVLDEDEDR
jgi:hypothetical protein